VFLSFLNFGDKDITYKAAGGKDGIRQLVDCFYDTMSESDRYQVLRNLHPDDLTLSRDKLWRFLCGWMGGGPTYQDTYGEISIPDAHAHICVTYELRDAWMSCMQEAIGEQSFSKELVEYLMTQLAFPAERIRQVSEQS